MYQPRSFPPADMPVPQDRHLEDAVQAALSSPRRSDAGVPDEVLSTIGRPGREIALGGLVVGIFSVVTLAMGVLMPLNAAVIAPGTVEVTGSRQRIQATGDGTISAIRVVDGQRVAAGQTLVEFAVPDLVASERSLASRVIGLQAEIAGLEAEQGGSATITPPAAFATYTGADAELAASALATEASNLASRRDVARAEQLVLRQRLAQTSRQMAGIAAHKATLLQQQALLDQEVNSVRTLAAKGYSSRNRLLEIERSAAELSGTVSASMAEAARLRSVAGETHMQAFQSASERRQTSTARLRDARAELQAQWPQWQAAKARLAQNRIVAPVAGTVAGLAVHTVGGVAQRGQTLLDVVPFDRILIVNASVPAHDGNDVSAGQEVLLRIPGLHGRAIPQMHGRIALVGADTQTDEHTGQPFYPVRVEVPQGELARFVRDAGLSAQLRPGTPVQVSIQTHPRSALAYWLDPILQTVREGLNEQ